MVAKAHQVFSSYFKELLEDYNLTPSQFGTLAFLWHNDGASQVQLGQKMRKDRTTISGIIDRLEKEQLVQRKEDPMDRRAHLIYLTPKALAIRGRLEELAIKANKDVTSMLSEQERAALGVILKKIIDGSKYEF
ncbi:MarR family winged helix-turn-helix transcriptional regulator [Desulfotruncus alcoholivorax]|uniref:MarR family winged helix-turn-helix transcriptional regulator n=1 Tax=Desulfotruncus alcoholivorax TaxID=265477 RepID=UPI0003FC78B4|nr:MarR family transcriptional regulator [Desulfotruncus alcoholivorax]